MTSWTKDELERVGESIHLQVETLRKNGKYRRPVTIWVVRVGDELFIRSYRGSDGAWFRHAKQQGKGRISAGGVLKEVSFVDVSDGTNLNNKIDTAYESKYQKYSAVYVDPMIASQARASTLKLVASS